MNPVLEASQLHRFFHAGDDETQALRGVSLEVDAGEVVAVTGPSGSGKSTLLACLAGLDEPDGGTVHVHGERMSRRSERARAALRARSIGIVFQEGNLLDHLTVDDNLALVQRIAGRADRARRHELLDDLGLAARARSRPSELSGGEVARAGLALALVNHPPVLLADEPTGEVDSANEATVLGLMRRRAERGVAMVIVTHSPAVAGVADRVIRLVDGAVAE
jgi:putative ABC transport system ATP-binding protein